MGESYSFELVEKAEQLYCVEGHTFEQVATLTGVAVSTLKRWSDRYGWQESKEKIRKALGSIRTNTIMLRARLIENCLTTLSAQDAFAVASLEGTAMKAAELAAKGQAASPAPEQLREIKTDEDAVAALEEAVQIKLNTLLTNPGTVSLAAVKEIKSAQDFVRGLRDDLNRKQAAGTTQAKKGLSLEAANELRRELLGMKA